MTALDPSTTLRHMDWTDFIVFGLTAVGLVVLLVVNRRAREIFFDAFRRHPRA